jgi:hypothetical protein
VLPDSNHIVGGAGGDDQGGDTLGHTVTPLGQAHQGRNNHRRRHGGQDKAQHKADGPGEAEDEVGEDGGRGGLCEAGDEGGLDDHTAAFRNMRRGIFIYSYIWTWWVLKIGFNLQVNSFSAI